MMFNQGLRYASWLALIVGPGDYYQANGFHMVLPVEPAVGRGPSCRSSSYSHAALPRPHAVRGCTCGTCPAVTSAAAVAGLLRETLGGRARTRGFGFFGMGGEGGELPAGAAADVPVFDLSDKAIEVRSYDMIPPYVQIQNGSNGYLCCECCLVLDLSPLFSLSG